jgi:hypothetical protein
MRKPPAHTLVLTAAVAALLVILAALALKYWITAPAARVVVALIPVPAYAALVLVTVAWVRTLDGLQQRMSLEAMTFAATTTGLLALLYGQLEKARVAPAVNIGFIAPALMILYAVGYALSSRRYQ